MLEIITEFMQSTLAAYILVVLTIVYTIYISNKYTQKPLRVVLILVGILVIIFRTAPGTKVDITGFAIVTTLLIPVIVVMILMVLLLDTLMARVLQEESQDISRYQYAIKLNLTIVFIMCVEWIPYFDAI